MQTTRPNTLEPIHRTETTKSPKKLLNQNRYLAAKTTLAYQNINTGRKTEADKTHKTKPETK